MSRLLGLVALVVGISGVFLGLLFEEEVALAFGTTLLGAGYALHRFGDPSRGGADVMVVYAASATLWFGLGNLVGFLSAGTSIAPRFFMWQSDAHLMEAQRIALAGLVVPIIVWELLRLLRGSKAWAPFLPGGMRPAGNGLLLLAAGSCWMAAWILRARNDWMWPSGFLGQLGELLVFGPVAAIFLLSRRLAEPDHGLPQRWKWVLVLLVVSEVAYGAIFSHLRSHTLWPIIAFLLPRILAQRIGKRHIAVAAATLAGVILLFDALAMLRIGRVVGRERLETLVATGERLQEEEAVASGAMDGAYSLAARLSTFNQLSRIAAMVEEDGTLRGETLAYMSYVFIPRILWPEKPMITPGRWFAEALGRGSESESGWSNAVNMTVPGELYLNFSWVGVIVGLSLMTVLYRILWDSCGLIRPGVDPVGSIVGYFVLAQAVFVGSHAGAIVNLVLWWIVLIAGRWAQALILRQRFMTSPVPSTTTLAPATGDVRSGNQGRTGAPWFSSRR